MVYIDRVNGAIVGVYARPQNKNQEQIDEMSTEIIAFKNQQETKHTEKKNKLRAELQKVATVSDLVDFIEKNFLEVI